MTDVKPGLLASLNISEIILAMTLYHCYYSMFYHRFDGLIWTDHPFIRVNLDFFEQPGRERCKFKILSERFFISPEKLVRLNGMPYTVGRNPFKNDISNVSNSIFH